MTAPHELSPGLHPLALPEGAHHTQSLEIVDAGSGVVPPESPNERTSEFPDMPDFGHQRDFGPPRAGTLDYRGYLSLRDRPEDFDERGVEKFYKGDRRIGKVGRALAMIAIGSFVAGGVGTAAIVYANSAPSSHNRSDTDQQGGVTPPTITFEMPPPAQPQPQHEIRPTITVPAQPKPKQTVAAPEQPKKAPTKQEQKAPVPPSEVKQPPVVPNPPVEQKPKAPETIKVDPPIRPQPQPDPGGPPIVAN